MKNEHQYQGAFSDFEEELVWNDFELRTYDPQIGRWLQQDPYDEFSSPYVGMGNDPVNVVDPSGGSVFDGILKAILKGGEGIMACPGASQWAGAVLKTGIFVAQMAFNGLHIFTTESSIQANKDFIEKANTKNRFEHNGLYDTPDLAAEAWALKYNKTSIENDKEFSSIIFEIEVNGQKKYCFTTGLYYIKAYGSGSSPLNKEIEKFAKPLMPSKYRVVAHIHSHGKHKPDDYDRNFSDYNEGQRNKGNVDARYKYDTETQTDLSISYYLVNPYGELKVRRGEGRQPGPKNQNYPENTDAVDIIEEGLPFDEKNRSFLEKDKNGFLPPSNKTRSKYFRTKN